MCEQHLTVDERATRPHDAVAFVDELVVAMTNARIYSRGHPRVELSIQALSEGFTALQHESGGGRVELGNADGFLFFDRRPLLGATLSARRLIEPLTALGSGGIAFNPATDREALRTLVGFLSRGCDGAERHTDANLALVKLGCAHVHFLPPYSDDLHGGDPDHGALEQPDSALQLSVAERPPLDLDMDLGFSVPQRLYQDVVHVMQDAMIKSCKAQAIELGHAQGFVENILGQLASDPQALMSLARYEMYDAFTFGHSIRVCLIALDFARQLTSDHRTLERIGTAALMHDIGKAWVPFEVLHSDRLLTNEERQEMGLHTVYGGQILLDTPDPDPLAVAVAFSHHQTSDGGGYPRVVRAPQQSTATMIVKISDVFEALTAVRPYKPRMSPTRAYRIMMSMAGHFEPSLLRRFIEVTGIYPTGSRVRLSDGSIARVHAQGCDIARPVVRTERASSGERLFPEDVEELDLSDGGAGHDVEVAELLLEAEL